MLRNSAASVVLACKSSKAKAPEASPGSLEIQELENRTGKSEQSSRRVMSIVHLDRKSLRRITQFGSLQPLRSARISCGRGNVSAWAEEREWMDGHSGSPNRAAITIKVTDMARGMAFPSQDAGRAPGGC